MFKILNNTYAVLMLLFILVNMLPTVKNPLCFNLLNLATVVWIKVLSGIKEGRIVRNLHRSSDCLLSSSFCTHNCTALCFQCSAAFSH